MQNIRGEVKKLECLPAEFGKTYILLIVFKQGKYELWLVIHEPVWKKRPVNFQFLKVKQNIDSWEKVENKFAALKSELTQANNPVLSLIPAVLSLAKPLPLVKQSKLFSLSLSLSIRNKWTS